MQHPVGALERPELAEAGADPRDRSAGDGDELESLSWPGSWRSGVSRDVRPVLRPPAARSPPAAAGCIASTGPIAVRAGRRNTGGNVGHRSARLQGEELDEGGVVERRPRSSRAADPAGGEPPGDRIASLAPHPLEVAGRARPRPGAAARRRRRPGGGRRGRVDGRRPAPEFGRSSRSSRVDTRARLSRPAAIGSVPVDAGGEEQAARRAPPFEGPRRRPRRCAWPDAATGCRRTGGRSWSCACSAASTTPRCRRSTPRPCPGSRRSRPPAVAARAVGQVVERRPRASAAGRAEPIEVEGRRRHLDERRSGQIHRRRGRQLQLPPPRRSIELARLQRLVWRPGPPTCIDAPGHRTPEPSASSARAGPSRPTASPTRRLDRRLALAPAEPRRLRPVRPVEAGTPAVAARAPGGRPAARRVSVDRADRREDRS